MKPNNKSALKLNKYQLQYTGFLLIRVKTHSTVAEPKGISLFQQKPMIRPYLTPGEYISYIFRPFV